jgi:hypothetical protein
VVLIVVEYAFAVVVTVFNESQDHIRAEFGEAGLLQEDKEIFKQSHLRKFIVTLELLLAEDEGERFQGFIQVLLFPEEVEEDLNEPILHERHGVHDVAGAVYFVVDVLEHLLYIDFLPQKFHRIGYGGGLSQCCEQLHPGL